MPGVSCPKDNNKNVVRTERAVFDGVASSNAESGRREKDRRRQSVHEPREIGEGKKHVELVILTIVLLIFATARARA